MEVDLIFKIAGIGILIGVFSIVLTQAKKEEQAQLLTLGGVLIVLLMLIGLMNRLFTTVRSVFNL